MEGTKRVLTTSDIENAAMSVVRQLEGAILSAFYGIPRGGVPAAFAIQAAWLRIYGHSLPIIPNGRAIRSYALIVDDIYDSGKTLKPYLDQGFTCAVLTAKGDAFGERLPEGLVAGDSTFSRHDWVVFPWEDETIQGPDDAVRRLLQYIGEDPDAPHLQETPRRFLSWLSEFRADQEPDFNETKFEVNYDGMVTVRNIPFTSLCAHHLLPFSGTATVGYIPESPVNTQTQPVSVLGLSKLARIVQHCAKRLQSQEEMTTQIGIQLSHAARSQSVAVIISAEHSCMNFRGPRVPGAKTITSKLTGDFFNDQTTRAEFMALAQQ